MAWMMDEYSTIQGKNQFGVVTGKPITVGGSLGRSDATAKGGMYTLREAAKKIGVDLKGATVAILGFGNAGSFAATLVQEMFGCKVVAVTDSKGEICIHKISLKMILFHSCIAPETIISHLIRLWLTE